MNKTRDNYDYHQYSSAGRDVDRSLRYRKEESSVKTNTLKSKIPVSENNVMKNYVDEETKKDDSRRKINEFLQNGNSKIAQPKSQDLSYSGSYVVTSNALNMRYVPGTIKDSNVVCVANKGAVLKNYGYFTKVEGKVWLLVEYHEKMGYVMMDFVAK